MYREKNIHKMMGQSNGASSVMIMVVALALEPLDKSARDYAREEQTGLNSEQSLLSSETDKRG